MAARRRGTLTAKRLAAWKGGDRTTTAPASTGKATAFTLRLDADRHDTLRRLAYEGRCSIHSIVMAALDDYLAKIKP